LLIDSCNASATAVIIILESTSFPGTTRTLVYEEILKLTDLNEGDIDCAFSPERVDPLNSIWNIRNTPKLVSGVNAKSTQRAQKFYEKFIDTVIEVRSPEIAEFAKLIENTYRLINISFVNEMMELCEAASLPINEILDAASSKPYGFNAFRPGLGAGGHCIPVDSVYLKSFSESLGYQPKLLVESISINRRIPNFHANKVSELVGTTNSEKSKILIVGVAYKSGVSDTRESPALQLIELLTERGFLVNWIDSNVTELNLAEKHKSGNKYDVVVINHPNSIDPVDFLNSNGQVYKI
jgi:UDP-N-acetyl-D-glucosamine dehydrogenase